MEPSGFPVPWCVDVEREGGKQGTWQGRPQGSGPNYRVHFFIQRSWSDARDVPGTEGTASWEVTRWGACSQGGGGGHVRWLWLFRIHRGQAAV